MAEFNNRDELKVWLNGRPRELSGVIAARAALRVLPLLAVEFSEGKLKPEAAASTIVLPVFRAMAVPWSAARYPDHGTDLVIRAAAAASGRSAALVAAAATTEAATHAARAAAHAALAATRVDAPAALADAIDALAVVAAVVHGKHAYALWKAVSIDATRLEKMDPVRSDILASEPLWPERIPRALWELRGDFENELSALGGNWETWISWYKARLAGHPTYPHANAEQNEYIEIARAKIDNEIYNKGPPAVFAKIRRLEKEILAKDWKAEPAHRPHVQVAAAIGARLAKTQLNTLLKLEILPACLTRRLNGGKAKSPTKMTKTGRIITNF